jgi:hypothetical protein
MNRFFSSYLDEISLNQVLILSVKGFRRPNLAKNMNTKMENDEKRGLHTLLDTNE